MSVTSTGNSKSITLKDIQGQIAKLNEMLNAYAEEEKKHPSGSDANEKVIASFKDPIKLNVGGQIFMASKSTLTKQEGLFSALFSGQYQLEKGEDSAYFIDRDSKHFGKILNFLRDGVFDVPNNETERQEVIREAEFYRLKGLIQHLNTNAKVAPSTAPTTTDPLNNLLAQLGSAPTSDTAKPDDLDNLLASLTGSTPAVNTQVAQPQASSIVPSAPKPEESTLPLTFDPERKASSIHFRKLTATNVSPQPLPVFTSTTFTTGVHTCTFAWTGDHIKAGVAGRSIKHTENIQWQYQQVCVCSRSGMQYGDHVSGQLFEAFKSPITMELDCDNRTVSWFIDGEKYTVPMHINLQPPYAFTADISNTSDRVSIVALK